MVRMRANIFIDLMKEYRRLDDTVTMRLNRATAQFMERDRMSNARKASSAQDEACAYFWTQLVGSWCTFLHGLITKSYK